MEYYEEQKIIFLDISAGLAMLVIIISAINNGDLLSSRVNLIVYAIGVGAIFFVWKYFRKLTIEIKDGALHFGFGLFSRKVNLSDITNCTPHELKFRVYWGYGIRFGTDGTICYNTRNGKGVRIESSKFRRPVVLSSNDPEKLCNLLNNS